MTNRQTKAVQQRRAQVSPLSKLGQLLTVYGNVRSDASERELHELRASMFEILGVPSVEFEPTISIAVE